MTKLTRAVVPALPLVLLLAACAPAVEPPADPASPVPTPSLSVPTPSVSADALAEGADLRAWADVALPTNRAGGAAAVVRGVLPIGGGTSDSIAIDQAAGVWDVLITCQSSDGSPLGYDVEGPTATGEPRELDCSTPGERQPSTAIIAFDGPGATLEVTTSADTVLAYEVRPHQNPEG